MDWRNATGSISLRAIQDSKDVYKRQQPHDAAHLWGSGGFLHRAALLEGDLSPGKQCKGSTHRNDAQSSDLYPVSYTHLDVYKRQVLHSI